DSILIGGTGDDSIDGGPGRDLIFGDHVLLDRSSAVTPSPNTPCAAQLGCFYSPLFQDLTGTQLYSTQISSEGALLTDGKWQLDPRGHASWGDYRITAGYVDPITQFVHNGFYDQVVDGGVLAGSDYIAGGGGNDMLFGEAGNDTIQGDGSIDFIAHPYVSDGSQGGTPFAYGYAAGCATGAHPGTATVMQHVGACRNATNNLLISPSVSRSSDGSDYIEGGGGNDVIFGDGAQNDILGGNSDFFGDGAAC